MELEKTGEGTPGLSPEPHIGRVTEPSGKAVEELGGTGDRSPAIKLSHGFEHPNS